MTKFFQFEADFVESLRCIPMQVRLKLDTCGIKMKLSDWNHSSKEDRETLVEMPCTTESEIQTYRQHLQQLILNQTGTLPSELPIDPHPAWIDETTIPESIQQKAQEFNLTLTPQQWATLTPEQRFALIKLSRSSHENLNFLPALKEFNLVES